LRLIDRWPAVLSGYFDVNKRVALIIGASRGLGLAMAKALAEVGATVIPNGATPSVYRSSIRRRPSR
jgi:hypothetical protein